MADITISNMQLALKDFLEGYPPPQYGRIVDGLPSDIQEQSGIDIGRGSVLRFHRKVNPNVPVSFKDPWNENNGDHFIKVTLPIDFQGKFRILPYDPVSGDLSEDHKFHTVEDLLESFPVEVQANASYGDRDESAAFDCGDRLKLLRLIYREGVKMLECRISSECRLMQLPMNCVGDFTVITSKQEYLLADLVSLLPRKRRVKLCSDPASKAAKIPGLPSNFTGDLYIEELEYFVEASPLEDEGLIIGLPHDLDMLVSPGEFDRGMLLNSFATNNRNLLPVVACVSDWDEETTILENHFIKPGVELVVHGWTRQSKVVARAGNTYYAIPLTYQGRFAFQPQQFDSIASLGRAYPGFRLRVLEVDHAEQNFPLAKGDVIRIKRGESLKKGKGDAKYLKCEKFLQDGTAKVKDVKLPVEASVLFEEILEETKNHDFSIKELVSFVSDQEIDVVLKQRSTDQRIPERDLPALDARITLCDFVMEPAVYVSVDTPDAPAFHVPLRSLLYVTFVEQLEKQSSPLLTKRNPKLSTLDRCVEILPEQVFQQLLRKTEGSDQFPTFHGATAFSGPSSASAWNGVSVGQLRSDAVNYERERLDSIPHSDVYQATTLPTSHRENVMSAHRHHHSTENVFRTSTNQETAMTLPRDESRNQRELTISIPPAAPIEPTSPGSVVTKGATARAYSSGGQTAVNGRSSVTVNGFHDQVSRASVTHAPASHAPARIHSPVPLQSPPPPLSPALSQVAPPAHVQVPPGYVLMPTAQAQAIPAGYSLVPVVQSHGDGHRMASYAGSHMGSMQRVYAPSVADDDSDVDDAMSDVSRFTLSKPPSFKVTIPPDGNLYHFSKKKFCELLRLLKMDESCIRACHHDKIDGKKFSRMTDRHMEGYGLLHPVMLHFRQQTSKKKASSKFAL